MAPYSCILDCLYLFEVVSIESFSCSFPLDEQMNMKSVVEYFQEMYGYTIQYTHLPCLQVGNQKKVNYLPMEVSSANYIPQCLLLHLNLLSSENWRDSFCQACKILKGQRYTKGLNEKQITSLLKVSCQRPSDQEMDILQVQCITLFSLNMLINCVNCPKEEENVINNQWFSIKVICCFSDCSWECIWGRSIRKRISNQHWQQAYISWSTSPSISMGTQEVNLSITHHIQLQVLTCFSC